MLRRLFRALSRLALLGAIAAAAAKLLQRRRRGSNGAAPPGAWPRIDLSEQRATSADPTEQEAAAQEREAIELERRMAETAAEAAARSTPPPVPIVMDQVTPEPVVSEPVGSEPAPAAAGTVAWVEPEDGDCPASHPVKAKLASKVFHLPGMMHYERTKPDRCYPDASAAEADGLRQAKR